MQHYWDLDSRGYSLEAIKNSFQKRCPQQNGLASLFVFSTECRTQNSRIEFNASAERQQQTSSTKGAERHHSDDCRGRKNHMVDKSGYISSQPHVATEPWNSCFLLGRSSPFIAEPFSWVKYDSIYPDKW